MTDALNVLDNQTQSKGDTDLRISPTLVALLLLALPAAYSQTGNEVVNDPALLAQLQRIFPAAAQFSAKSGSPPTFRALAPGASGQEPEVIGYVYWTTELEPLERAFDGPVKMLVGMDTKGAIAGVIVTEHREPYGYFSVDLPDWPKQFEGKSVRDPFKYGDDVDAISRATITVTSASRAIRNSSRRVARAYLAPPGQQ